VKYIFAPFICQLPLMFIQNCVNSIQNPCPKVFLLKKDCPKLFLSETFSAEVFPPKLFPAKVFVVNVSHYSCVNLNSFSLQVELISYHVLLVKILFFLCIKEKYKVETSEWEWRAGTRMVSG